MNQLVRQERSAELSRSSQDRKGWANIIIIIVILIGVVGYFVLSRGPIAPVPSTPKLSGMEGQCPNATQQEEIKARVAKERNYAGEPETGIFRTYLSEHLKKNVIECDLGGDYQLALKLGKSDYEADMYIRDKTNQDALVISEGVGLVNAYPGIGRFEKVSFKRAGDVLEVFETSFLSSRHYFINLLKRNVILSYTYRSSGELSSPGSPASLEVSKDGKRWNITVATSGDKAGITVNGNTVVPIRAELISSSNPAFRGIRFNNDYSAITFNIEFLNTKGELQQVGPTTIELK